MNLDLANNAQFDPALIKTLRHKLRMSQEEFAHHLGVSVKSLHRWETGKGVPSPQTLYQIMELARQNKDYSTRNAIAPTIDYLRRHQKCTRVDVMICRLSRRFTQEKFAEELGVSLKTVQRWEKGETKMSQFYVAKINKFIETHPEYSLHLLTLG